MQKDVIKFGLDDISIEPAVLSDISHRNSCDVYYNDVFKYQNSRYTLPIFTAPMPSVVNIEQYHKYMECGIIPILPRTETLDVRLEKCREDSLTTTAECKTFSAFSLDEFISILSSSHILDNNSQYYMLIDMANGHMRKLYDIAKKAKTEHPNITLMIGNIANPKTFEEYAKIGVDYCRVSIGSGNACTTTCHTGIYYPMGSLIQECKEIKDKNKYNTKIVADGGISNFRNMIKCLALGADFIMLGSALNKRIDSAGEIVDTAQGNKGKLYFGMASYDGQRSLGKAICTPEGKTIINPLEGTISEFATDFEAYLKSAMSYTNSYCLSDFKNYTNILLLSDNASKQFNQTQN